MISQYGIWSIDRRRRLRRRLTDGVAGQKVADDRGWQSPTRTAKIGHRWRWWCFLERHGEGMNSRRLDDAQHPNGELRLREQYIHIGNYTE